MKLIKLTEEHYVVVDNSKIQEGEFVYDLARCVIGKHGIDDYLSDHYKKITHSTQPLGIGWQQEVIELSLQEVKDLIGKVDVEKKADKMFAGSYFVIEGLDIAPAHREGYVVGYNQALEDNKDKKYTEERMWRMFMSGHGLKSAIEMKMIEDKPMGEIFKELLERYNPTEWEVEIVDGKLKLK